MSLAPHFIEKIDTSLLSKNQLTIAMPFAKEIILNPKQRELIEERVIIKLELVYTKYRTAESFNQKELNRNRIVELKKLIPSLFENRLWEFSLISQTKGNSREECKSMFHGFILTFRPNSSPTNLKKEASYLNNITTSFLNHDSIDNLPVDKKIYRIKTRYDLTMGYLHDTIWHVDTIPPPSPPDFFYNQSLYQDSTVLSVFNRNKSWNNFAIVIDATGSMSPYIAQVFVWLKNQLKNEQVKAFVFFNDGDQKSSREKTPLKTKGIYHTSKKELNAVTKAATKCIQNGDGGGEGLENDVEALLKTIELFPYVEHIVLIADNYESMRDYEFIKEVKKPVHTIMCGAEQRINVQYLDLARQTKGSVHTIKSDVTNLNEIKEGQYFFIENKEYRYKKGRFHSIYENRPF